MQRHRPDCRSAFSFAGALPFVCFRTGSRRPHLESIERRGVHRRNGAQRIQDRRLQDARQGIRSSQAARMDQQATAPRRDIRRFRRPSDTSPRGLPRRRTRRAASSRRHRRGQRRDDLPAYDAAFDVGTARPYTHRRTCGGETAGDDGRSALHAPGAHFGRRQAHRSPRIDKPGHPVRKACSARTCLHHRALCGADTPAGRRQGAQGLAPPRGFAFFRTPGRIDRQGDSAHAPRSSAPNAHRH